MRRFRVGLFVLAGVAATMAVAAPAGASSVVQRPVTAATAATLVGGRTTVAIPPSTTSVLLRNAIVPLPVGPGRVRPTFKGGLGVQASFPVTGGSVDLAALTGTINHSGGLKFVNLRSGQSLKITDFDIELGAHPQLTAFVPALNARTTIFDLDLSAAQIATPSSTTVVVSNVAVTLAAGAASALNSSLGTDIFVGGLPIGTATTTVKVG